MFFFRELFFESMAWWVRVVLVLFRCLWLLGGGWFGCGRRFVGVSFGVGRGFDELEELIKLYVCYLYDELTLIFYFNNFIDV